MPIAADLIFAFALSDLLLHGLGFWVVLVSGFASQMRKGFKVGDIA